MDTKTTGHIVCMQQNFEIDGPLPTQPLAMSLKKNTVYTNLLLSTV